MHTFAKQPKPTQQTTSAKSAIASRANFNQRNQAVQRMLLLRYPSSAPAQCLPGPIQGKLKVGAIDDPIEHEANRVADQAMRMRVPDTVTDFAPLQVSRKCDVCEDEENLQKNETGPQTVAGEAPASVHETLRSPGQSLDTESRAFFEPRFGREMSQVRIHTDMRAAESAHSVYARAYTVGNHVVFGRDQYAPHTAEGRHLLAHELAHTMQQHGSAPSLRRDPPKSPPPTPPGLETRLNVIEETGPATRQRLDEIIRTGGPIPDTKAGAKVIAAAIIDVQGYQGPKEMRAISGADTDALGQGAPVYHAPSPTTRTLSATQGEPTLKGGRRPSITGPRKESINPHINDAEIKLFEEIISRLPKGAKGTIHFTTVRVRQVEGQTVIEPYPACSGCIRGSFETAGMLPQVDLVSHAPTHPPGQDPFAGPPGGGGEHGKPGAGGGGPAASTTGPAPLSQHGSVSPSVGSAAKSPQLVSPRELAAELARNEVQTRRMEQVTKAVTYFFGVWNAWNVLKDAANALNMSTSILAHGSPYWTEIQQAQGVQTTAAEVERYYASLNVLKNQMPSKGDPEWNSEYDLYQIQITYVLMEQHLSAALESIKVARCALDGHCDAESLGRLNEETDGGLIETALVAAQGGQIGQLRDALAGKVTAMVAFPVMSVTMADAYFFAEAGGRINQSLLVAREHYASAQEWVEHHRRMARAAIDGLERRLMELELRRRLRFPENVGE